MERVRLEVITYAPTAFYHCQHCEVTFSQARGLGDAIRRDQAASALPDDLLLAYQDLSDWTHEMVHRFGDRLDIRIIDAASLEGVVKSLRHRVRRYPAVIVGGRATSQEGDYGALEPVIERHLEAPAGA